MNAAKGMGTVYGAVMRMFQRKVLRAGDGLPAAADFRQRNEESAKLPRGRPLAPGDSKPMTGITQQKRQGLPWDRQGTDPSAVAMRVDWALSWFPSGRAYDWADGVGNLVPGLP